VDDIVARLQKQGILVGRKSENQLRLVLHLWISDDDVQRVIQGFSEVIR
jgi:hypothetical protein